MWPGLWGGCGGWEPRVTDFGAADDRRLFPAQPGRVPGPLGKVGGGPCSWSWLSPYTLMVMPSDPPGPLTCTTMRVLLSPLSESCSR